MSSNRHGLCTDLHITPSVGVTEPQAAEAMLRRQRRRRIRPKALAADKGYHTRAFVGYLRERPSVPRVVPGLVG